MIHIITQHNLAVFARRGMNICVTSCHVAPCASLAGDDVACEPCAVCRKHAGAISPRLSMSRDVSCVYHAVEAEMVTTAPRDSLPRPTCEDKYQRHACYIHAHRGHVLARRAHLSRSNRSNRSRTLSSSWQRVSDELRLHIHPRVCTCTRGGSGSGG